MLKAENLKMSFYDYLEYCLNKQIKGVAVITDKQYIFYSQIDDKYDCNHDDIYIMIEDEIYNKNDKFIKKNNIYVASLGKEMIIYLPESKLLSMSQYKFLEKMLDQVDIYNKKYNTQLLIYAAQSNTLYERLKTRDVECAKKTLYNWVTKEIFIDDEKIIGHVLDDSTQIDCMKYHIDLEDCKILIDLYPTIDRCSRYYNDTFYNEKIKRIFPNFIKIKDDVSILESQNQDNLDISNISYDNIEEYLSSKINIKKL